MHSSKTYKKIVIITSRFPYPLEKGDKLRAYYQIKELSEHFEIHLMSTSEKRVKKSDIAQLQPFCKSINVFKIGFIQKYWNVVRGVIGLKPIQVAYFYRNSIQRKINRLLKEIKPNHIYCQLVRAAEYVKDYHDCKKTIDYMDALSKGMKRRSENSSFLKKMIFEMECFRLAKYENSIFEYFENHTIISDQDKHYILHQKRNLIDVVPNGVDSSFLELEEEPKITKDIDLVFTGNMSYAPNVTAAKFIVNEILPLLPENTRVKIAGSSPSREVLKLASSRVIVTGYVDDIKAAYRSAEIFIAPMFLGTGLQNKLLEAMAVGIPCITTSLANNALGATLGKEILLANDAGYFAREILRLQNNPQLKQNLIDNGRTFIAENYNWKTVTAKLVQLIND